MTSFNIYDHATQKQIDQFQPTFLYIKQHAITKKLYFGMTGRQNVEKYNGSGTYWKKHIKKNGKEHVTTLWYCLFTDIETLVETAIILSETQNIVESKDWANLVPENCLHPNGMLGKKHTTATKLKQSMASSGKPKSPTHCLSISKSRWKLLSIEGAARRAETTAGNLIKETAEERKIRLYNRKKRISPSQETADLIIKRKAELKILRASDPNYVKPLRKTQSTMTENDKARAIVIREKNKAAKLELLNDLLLQDTTTAHTA